MTGTNCDLFTHNQSRSYMSHLVLMFSGDGRYIVEAQVVETSQTLAPF
jgi:hypothetical protein